MIADGEAALSSNSVQWLRNAVLRGRPRGTGPRPLAQRAPGDRRLVVLVTLFQAGSEAPRRILDEARRFPRLRFVVATEDSRVAPFFAAGVVAEHFPAAATVRAWPAAGDWDRYLRNRWLRLIAKWDPVLVREDGIAFDRYLEACGLSRPSCELQGAGPCLRNSDA